MVLSTNGAFNVIGALGEVILATAMIPQIYLAHKLNSTECISYAWQAVYTTGMLALISYDLYFRLWPIFFPAVFELLCLLYLTGLKIYFEQIRSPPPEKWDLSESTRGSETSSAAAAVSPERTTYTRLSNRQGSSEARGALNKQDKLESNYGSTKSSVDKGDEHA